jgi:hypothetical protein
MQNKNARNKSLRPQVQRLSLEPRIVFDAALPIAAIDFIDAHHAQAPTEAPQETLPADHITAPALAFAPIESTKTAEKPAAEIVSAEAGADKTAVDIKSTATDSITTADAAPAERLLIDGTLAPTNLTSHEIIFIDAIVSDLQQYITDHPNADVVLLDSTKDALDQIATTLAGRTDISAIHILSHGTSGELQIGNGVLNLQNLTTDSHAADLAIIKNAMTENGDILIYGCNVGSNAKGQAFINALQANTGADIAASTNVTGAAAFGADWVLEAQVGTIGAATLTAKDWQHVLVDTDGDGIDDAIDLDDDNDGILDATEYRSVTLNVISVLPAGTYGATQAGTGLRVADSTGQYYVDIYRDTASSAGATNTFNATTGLIAGGTSLENTEFVQLVYTTALSPTAWQLSRVAINSINSLTPGPGATGVRDAYVWSEAGTWTPLGTGGASSAGAVVSVNTATADDVGTFIRNDPDGGNVLTDIGQFTTVTAQDATLSDVLLNMVGGGNGHNAQFDPNLPVTTMSLYVFNSGGGGMAWNFLPQMTVQVPVDTDGDGIANHLDLDSDNDGISDLFESTGGTGDALADTNKNGTVSLAEAIAAGAAGDGDLDNDGLLDIFDANTAGIAGSVGNTPINTDSDSRADFLDLDSDNDGIADTVEARLSAGYVTNDGNVSNDDADGDGVIGLFDSSVGFGGSFTTPVNTDAQGGLYTPDANTITFTGKPTKATFVNSVGNLSTTSITRILTTDASSSRFNSSTDRAALDLGQILPTGATVTIVALRSNTNAGNTLKISQSSNGSSAAALSNTSNLAFSATNAYQTLTYIVNAPTRFIDLGFNRVGGNLDIDSVAWSYTAATSGPLYDYIDSDSDNDGVTDKLESGLTLTGVDANKDGIDDGVGASYIDPDGAINAPLGATTGLKNNDVVSADVDFRSLNIGGVNVNTITVNEASPYAVFTLSRALPAPTAVNVKLTLQSGDGDPATSDAIIGTDTGTQLQVFNGTIWVNYTAGTDVTVPAGTGTLLVRVAITNDNPAAIFEGPELFRLVATNSSTSAVSVGGYGTIFDDGTGVIYTGAVAGGIPTTSTTGLDDDRPLAISDVTVNEASPFATFSVAGVAGTTIQLNLATTGTGAGNAILGTDTSTQLQVFNGTSWVNYIAGSNVNLDVNGELLVRVSVTNDTPYEGAETFTLTGKIVTNNISTFGTGTIIDDGTGDIYLASNLTPDPNLVGDVGYPAALDDDRPLNVTSPTVTEGTDTYAIFIVTGVGGQTVSLAMASTGTNPATAEINDILNDGEDFGNGGLEYSLDGITWEPYAIESEITIPAGGNFQVLMTQFLNQLMKPLL